MFVNLFLVALMLSGINAHVSNTKLISLLKSELQTLKKNDPLTQINNIETELQQKIDTALSAISGTASGSKNKVKVPDVDFFTRLTLLESRIEEIKRFLTKEKKGDDALRARSDDVIGQMNGKVGVAQGVINQLKTDVKNSITDFEDKIAQVNKTAYIKINANGAVLYGGVGSSCTSDGGECKTDRSECRGGKCQCVAGLSYNLKTQTCEASCDTYGTTYQSVPRWIIRGYNDLSLEDVSLHDCTERCNTVTSFTCRSFDYFPQWQACFLSQNTKMEAEEDAWEYNTEGYHFQRDCNL